MSEPVPAPTLYAIDVVTRETVYVYAYDAGQAQRAALHSPRMRVPPGRPLPSRRKLGTETTNTRIVKGPEAEVIENEYTPLVAGALDPRVDVELQPPAHHVELGPSASVLVSTSYSDFVEAATPHATQEVAEPPARRTVHRARGIAGETAWCPQCKASPGEPCDYGEQSEQPTVGEDGGGE